MSIYNLTTLFNRHNNYKTGVQKGTIVQWRNYKGVVIGDIDVIVI